MMYRIELCHDRLGKAPHLIAQATAPDRLEMQMYTLDGSQYLWHLTRGDIALLRGLLPNLAAWERAAIHAGLLDPDLTMDRPAGMDRYFYTKPPTSTPEGP